jgi:hypothetical protein
MQFSSAIEKDAGASLSGCLGVQCRIDADFGFVQRLCEKYGTER